MTWHADAPLLARYAAGDLDPARSLSVEAHMVSCATCRAALAPLADRERLDGVWDELVETIDAPRPGLVERLLARIGVAEHLARLLAATPSLRLSWLAAVALTLAFAAIAAAEGERGALVFLVLAPLLPVAGVAAAFGPELDPTYRVGLAAPFSTARLLLLRAVVVLLTTTLLAGAAALVVPGLGWAAAAWLLPALGLTLATLALATAVPPPLSAGSVAMAWVVLVAGAERFSPSDLAAFRSVAQVLYLVVAIGAALVLALRINTFEIERSS
jgi:hypothetical protein